MANASTIRKPMRNLLVTYSIVIDGSKQASLGTEPGSVSDKHRFSKKRSLTLPGSVSASVDPKSYSVRSACMGSMDAARCAGIMLATNAQMASDSTATESASGSVLPTS